MFLSKNKRLINKAALSALTAALLLCACAEKSESSGPASSVKNSETSSVTEHTLSETAVTTKAESSSLVIPKPGKWGEEINWELTEDGTLNITGTGAMPDMFGRFLPWEDSKDQIKKIVISDGIETIGSAAFSRCSELCGVVIPDSVRMIGESAFYSCTSLTEITVPDSVQLLGKGVFWECTNLEKAKVGSGVKELTYNTFCKCRSLKSVELSDGLESIGDCAFEYCESLSEITVPGTVTSFGSSVFSGAGDILIKGGKGSAAEEYAIKREHRFEAL